MQYTAVSEPAASALASAEFVPPYVYVMLLVAVAVVCATYTVNVLVVSALVNESVVGENCRSPFAGVIVILEYGATSSVIVSDADVSPALSVVGYVGGVNVIFAIVRQVTQFGGGPKSAAFVPPTV